jgi:pimeloyl-ACP methyl ester carboxylesterase
MPAVRRPGGVEIHWEQGGSGPLVALAQHMYSFPGVYEALADELARDHRVVAYDARGTGDSTRVAPRSMEEDADDLAAVIEQTGSAAVVVGQGDAAYRAAIVASARPDLVGAVVTAGASVLPPVTLLGTEGPSASSAVLDALLELAQHNYRAAVRGLLQLTNPGMSSEELRARVDETMAYSSDEAGLARAQWFRDAGALERMRDLGDRLWIARWESTWSPAAVTRRLGELLPEARVELIQAGPISRPEQTADVVRRAVAETAAKRDA